MLITHPTLPIPPNKNCQDSHLPSPFLAILLFIIFQGCNAPTTQTLPSSTGKKGEVLISLENRFQNSSLESAIGSVLGEELPALPQPEALFSFSVIPKTAFTGLLKVHQCILIIELSNDLQDPVSIQKNKWAKPQIVVRVAGRDEVSIHNTLIENKTRIQQAFLSFELAQSMKTHRKNTDQNLQKIIEEQFRVSLDVPKGFSMANTDSLFIWLREETPETSLGLLLHTYNYIGNDSLTVKSVLNKRNQITKKFVPGPSEGSYMSTMEEFPVVGKEIYLMDRPALELRGLWNVKGDFMGGPFVSYAILDTNNNEILYIEGFVYAPKYNKRNYVKRLEAILLSLRYN